MILPLTTNLVDDAEPLRLRITAKDGLSKDSDLLVDQLLAIDNKRLIDGPLTCLEASAMTRVYQAVSEVLGMEVGTGG